jgi:hypothetical protein
MRVHLHLRVILCHSCFAFHTCNPRSQIRVECRCGHDDEDGLSDAKVLVVPVTVLPHVTILEQVIGVGRLPTTRHFAAKISVDRGSAQFLL